MIHYSDMEGESHSQEQSVEARELPSNVEEVFPGGYRLTKGATILDVPQSWAIRTAEGFLVIDPGGELPLESAADVLSAKSIAATLTNSLRSHKIDGLRALEEMHHVPVVAVLLTHGDADHTNNLESVAAQNVPIYLDRHEWWSTLSPELQFAAGAVNFRKSALTGHSAGALEQRDKGMQALAKAINNPRGGENRHERKADLAKRFVDFPESFPIADGQLEVVALPGHAPGEHGFYVPKEKIFIGGDLIMTSKKEQADRMNIFLPEANIYQAISSLKKLQSMDIEQYFPAHGTPIVGRENFQQHVQMLLDDAQALIERILECAETYQQENVHDLVEHVFIPQFDRPGMSEQSKKSWIMSVLRDRPEIDIDHVAAH